ncbi:MAG: hypothetical protein WCH04_15675 [Gammaproteobacteria bacterium]
MSQFEDVVDLLQHQREDQQITAVLFVLVAQNYQGDTFLHEEIPEAAAGSES